MNELIATKSTNVTDEQDEPDLGGDRHQLRRRLAAVERVRTNHRAGPPAGARSLLRTCGPVAERVRDGNGLRQPAAVLLAQRKPPSRPRLSQFSP